MNKRISIYLTLLIPCLTFGFDGLKLGEKNIPEISKKIYIETGGLPARLFFNESSNEYITLWGNGAGLTNYIVGDNAVQYEAFPFTVWEPGFTITEINNLYNLESDPEFAQEYEHFEDPSTAPTSCLPSNPLRYGDIDGDGNDEVVVFLDYQGLVVDMVVFSPLKEQIAFAARLVLEDSYEHEEGNNDTYQYTSGFYANKGFNSATRVYAKVFFNSFTSDEEKEIIVWRKRYSSNELKEKKGFHLVNEHFQIYQLVDGVYQLQLTGQNTIQDILIEKELTWQQGYPSKSECEGQEGQLIPEMHDPLLNDPDVLY